VIRENVQFLKRIPKKEHHLYLISSRFGFLEQLTGRLVRKHGFDTVFDGLFFNFQNEQPHLFKREVIKKLQLDMYVDDDLPLLRYVARHNKRTKFYWLNKKTTGQLSFNIRAITSLSEILPHKTTRTVSPAAALYLKKT
jgi:hypothetical protein